jgi:DNA polymerase III subunit gamma/tau
LAGDLQQKLRDWTGVRWSVSVSNDGGAPTLAEQKKNAKAARIESVAQAPLVRAVLDRFPGAEIVAVRDVEAPEPAPSQIEADE